LALTILEAQASGTPAIVFNSGGMPEAIKENFSGLVVPEKNEKALSEAIMSLLTDEKKWQAFSQYSRKFVVENHNLEVQSKTLEKIYEQVINNYINKKSM
ncbi:MAG: glycosyltransferase, partial [Methanobacteriaceae archaeon]